MRSPAPDAGYRLLRQDARHGLWRAVFVEGISLDALRAGLPMDVPAETARVTVSPEGDVPSDFLELPCPVVSDAMRRVLDHAGVDNVQYFPAHVGVEYAEDAQSGATDYWIANVVGAVACAEPLPAAVTAGRTADAVADDPPPSFRVDPSRARGFSLFRLAENRRLLMVSGRVAAALGAAGLRGVVLQPSEEYTGLPVRTAPPAPDSHAAPTSGPRRPW